MKCYLGVDLGSTMSKAVLLDEAEAVLGAAVCSTRGRHADSIARAQAAAVEQARLGLMERGLAASGTAAAAATLAAVERALRRRRHRRDLARLAAQPALKADAALSEAVRRLAELQPGDSSIRELITGAFAGELQALAARHRVPTEELIAALESAAATADAAPASGAADGELEAGVEDAAAAGELAAADLEAARYAAAAASREALDIAARTGTGYGRSMLPFGPSQLEGELRSEILCHALGAHRLFPDTRTVLDIGGQDTKAIHVDEVGRVVSFQMNDRCAAGCGRYLGYVADELGLSLDEMAAMASSDRAAAVSATCTVFAGAEVRELLAAGVPLPEVLAGLHEAVAERAIGLLARAGEIRGAVTFTGGVSRNAAVAAAVRRLLRQHLGIESLNVAPGAIFAGALGAALFARRRTAEAAP